MVKFEEVDDKFKEFGQSANGNFFMADETVAPHPYMITHHHVGHASDNHGGMLNDAAIEECEKAGHGCGFKNCNLSFKEHEKVLIVSCGLDVVTSEGEEPTEEIAAARKELEEWLVPMKEKVEEAGYAGFTFMKGWE